MRMLWRGIKGLFLSRMWQEGMSTQQFQPQQKKRGESKRFALLGPLQSNGCKDSIGRAMHGDSQSSGDDF